MKSPHKCAKFSIPIAISRLLSSAIVISALSPVSFKTLITPRSINRGALYLFERGGAMGSSARAGNSNLKVQALDAKGNLIGSQFTIGASMWNNAGYAIDTMEIGSAQKVGSFGLSSKNGAIAGLRLITDSTGADFKVIASSSTKVPEPTALLGMAAIGSALAVRRRKLAK
jgi:PEP-CTERM motif